MFVEGRPEDEAELLHAYESQLPEAEKYLDGILEQAKKEARLFSNDAAGPIALVERVRRLSST
jgi:F0F1-type ATP synthase membrane subunit b/b'